MKDRYFYTCPVTQETSEDLTSENYIALGPNVSWYSKTGLEELQKKEEVIVVSELAGGVLARIDRSVF